VLVNTARGPVVHEEALAIALEDGTIFGAGIDVFEREPEVHPRLLAAPHTVLLPHIGSASEATRRRMAQLAGGGDPAPPHRDPKLLDRMLRATKERTHFRQPGPPPRFAAGDRVFTRTDAPEGHTRLPRYARGKYGVIDAVHGTFIFPDTNAHGQGEQSHALYSVRFDANDLWGASAEPCSPVHLDLWERYLEPAGAAPGRSTS